MRSIQSGTVAFLCLVMSLFASDEKEVAVVMTRSDTLSAVESDPDQYFEGYIQALVDMHYAEYQVVVLVKGHEVWLANLPKNKLIANSIMTFVKDVPGVKSVHILSASKDKTIQEQYVNRPKMSGIWFPQMTLLFQPCVADPRNVTNALGWRSGDKVCGNKAADISLGEDFGIYRWLDVIYHGDVQIGIESGIWSVFNMHPSHPNLAGGTSLVNTDFYVGIPITYARDKWAFRLRGYHISSHLGDEFLVNHPGFVNVQNPNKPANPTQVRVNPSNEYIDFAASYQATEELRLYAFPGVIVHSDVSYPWKPLYIQYGTEVRFLGTKFYKQKLHGTVYVAMHWRNYQELNWDFDGTYMVGYEFSKLQGIGRKFRFYIEYHHGFSLEGQFSKLRTHYMEYNLNYGF